MTNKSDEISPAIFIVGNSRSGTTMMSNILTNHPDIFCFGEFHFFEGRWSSRDKYRLLTKPQGILFLSDLLNLQKTGHYGLRDVNKYKAEAEHIVTSIPDNELSLLRLFKEFLFYETKKNQKRIPCEKTPRNLFYLDEIFEILPQSKIINMIRDPRDVLASQKHKWQRRFLDGKQTPYRETLRSWLNYQPITASTLWNSSVNAIKWFSHDERVYSVRFEDILNNPEKKVRELAAFLNIPYYDNLLNVSQFNSSTVSDDSERLGINRERTGSWERGGVNNTEIYICQKINARLMIEHGYTIRKTLPNPLMVIYYFITFPILGIISLIANIRRSKNILEFIKRRIGISYKKP